jgi:hypothetical protein
MRLPGGHNLKHIISINQVDGEKYQVGQAEVHTFKIALDPRRGHGFGENDRSALNGPAD